MPSKIQLSAIVADGLTNYLVPVVFLRSAMFSSQRFRGSVVRPRHLNANQLSSTEPNLVAQTDGEQLDQADAELFFELLRQWLVSTNGKLDPLTLKLKYSQVLESIGRTKSGHSIMLLKDSLLRLSNALLQVEAPGTFSGELGLLSVDSSGMGSGSRGFSIQLDARLAPFFESQNCSYISKAQFKALEDDPIARWLLAYYSTHREPFHVLASTLQPLLGREASQQSKYLQVLRASVANLKRVTKWPVCEVATRDDREPRVIVDKGLPKSITEDAIDDDI